MIKISVGVAAHAIPGVVARQAEAFADLKTSQRTLNGDLVAAETALAATRDELVAMKSELQAVKASLDELGDVRARMVRLAETIEVQTMVSN